MARAWNPNLEVLGAAVAGLGPLCDQMVFLGVTEGTAVGNPRFSEKVENRHQDAKA